MIDENPSKIKVSIIPLYRYTNIVYTIKHISETFFDDKNFQKFNKKTIQLYNEVEKRWKYLGIPALILGVNFCAFSCKKPLKIKKNNSLLYISGRGCGKSELLLSLIGGSNKNAIQVLDSKVHESFLVQQKNDFFNRRVMIREDLITTFTGMDKKQREQLMNFFNEVLEGRYSRLLHSSKKIEADTALFAGIAEETFATFRGELFDSTFFDRVVPFRYSFSMLQKKDISDFELNKELNEVPFEPLKLKLPYYKCRKLIKFKVTKDILEKIASLALELDYFDVLSVHRARDFIKLLMMGNALLNERYETNETDLQLYELLHPFFVNALHGMTNEQKVLKAVRWKEAKKKSDKQAISAFSIARATYYRFKSKLKEKGLIT